MPIGSFLTTIFLLCYSTKAKVSIYPSRFRFLVGRKNNIVGATKAKTTEAGARKVTPLLHLGEDMIDLSDPTLDEQLRRRTPEGRYEISEIELVINIRQLKVLGDMAGMRRLSTVLLYRCAPAFQRHSQGLRHRPELREEVIANMSEHLLREAQDPGEIFITQNFIHYLRCLCADEFNRVLRQEGLYYRRDEEGRPSGRPQHVPRALVESLRPPAPDDEGTQVADVADPNDQYEEMHAEAESMRILTYLHDPLDRMIMVLRAIEGMKWDDIAVVCKRTERTVRLRYERARSHLRECVNKERHNVAYTPINPSH